MALRERLIYAIEIVGDGVKTGMGGIRSAIGEADGVVNKFKAGTASAFASVGANAGLMAAGAATAIGAFAAKSVTAFTETAKAAIDLHTSTGLTIEDSSRWIALGDDYQVTSEALATGLGKVAKTMESTKWSKYGIETRNAAGEARSVNDILLDTFDMLSKVTNETDRARIGQELFGKGYQSLTPLLGHTREEYEKLLATQIKGQVITEAEAKKAEETRLAMDELHDTINEVALEIGQRLAPAFADLAHNIADTVAIADKLKVFDLLEFGMKSSALNMATEGWKKLKGVFGGSDGVVQWYDQATTKSQDLVQASIDAAEADQGRADSLAKVRAQGEQYVSTLIAEGLANAEAADKAEDKAESEEEAADKTRRHEEASSSMADALDRERSATLRLIGGDIAIREAKRASTEAYVNYKTAVAEGTIAAGQEQAAVDEVVQAFIRQAQVVAENRLTQMQANGETVNAAVQQQVMRDALGETAGALDGPFRQALLDQIALLDNFERPRTANLSIVQTTSGLLVSGNTIIGGARTGQRVVGARGALVNRRVDGITLGEDGPEVVTPLDEMPGASPLGPGVGGGGAEVHHHWHVGTLVHESQLAQLMNRVLGDFQRNGGRLTFTTKTGG